MKLRHVDDVIDEWHMKKPGQPGYDQLLSEYLGMTWDEYGLFVTSNVIPDHLKNKYTTKSNSA